MDVVEGVDLRGKNAMQPGIPYAGVHPHARDPQAAARLWDVSERWPGRRSPSRTTQDAASPRDDTATSPPSE